MVRKIELTFYMYNYTTKTANYKRTFSFIGDDSDVHSWYPGTGS